MQEPGVGEVVMFREWGVGRRKERGEREYGGGVREVGVWFLKETLEN